MLATKYFFKPIINPTLKFSKSVVEFTIRQYFATHEWLTSEKRSIETSNYHGSTRFTAELVSTDFMIVI